MLRFFILIFSFCIYSFAITISKVESVKTGTHQAICNSEYGSSSVEHDLSFSPRGCSLPGSEGLTNIRFWRVRSESVSLISNTCADEGISGLSKFKVYSVTTTVTYFCDLKCDIDIPSDYLPTGQQCDTAVPSGFLEPSVCGCPDEEGVSLQYAKPDPDDVPPKEEPPTPDECHSEVGSYVIPKTRAFHEDIAIAGTTLSLHYSSNYTSGFLGADAKSSGLLALGWDIAVHHRLFGKAVHKGDGTVLKNVVVTHGVDGSSVVEKSLRYHFNANNLHVKTSNVLTNAVVYTFTYDDAKKLTRITDGNGNVLWLHYNAQGHVALLETDTYQRTTLSVDANTTLQSVTYEDGAAYEFRYDANALMLQEREPKGNLFTHLFDSSGRITQVHDDEGGIYAYETSHSVNYDESIIHYPQSESVIYRNYALENGFLRSTVTYASGDTRTTKTSPDKKTVITQQCGMTTTKRYNATHPLTHEPLLSSLNITTPSGLSYLVHYDNSIDEQSQEQIITHNAQSRRYSIDYANHEIHVKTAQGDESKFYYDEHMQHLLKYTSPGRLALLYEYDAKGRVTRMTQGLRHSDYVYDERGNLARVSDATGAITQFRYDARDRLKSITKPNGDTLSFNYDANGNMTQLHTPSSSTNTFTYNGVNKESSWQSPSGYITQYRYDKQRRLSNIIRPSGKTEGFTYTNGQLTGIETEEETLTLHYTCGNKLQSISNTHGETLTYRYDGELLSYINSSGILNERIDFSYNNSFLIESISYANGTEALAYDGDGRVIQNGSASLSYTPRSTTLQSDNFTTKVHVNAYGEHQSISNHHNSKLLYSQSITSRDLNGKIRATVEHINNKTLRKNYQYDSNGRLIRSKSVSGTVVVIPFDGMVIPILTDKSTLVETYTYNNEGNRITQSITKDGTLINKTASYTIDNALEFIGDTFYTYDDDGYLTSKTDGNQTTTYEYGTKGELRSVMTPTQTITYRHNANNQRVAKLINGEIVEKYLWLNLTTLLAIYDKDDNLITRYSYANSSVPYKMGHNSQTYYLSYNHLGSLRAVTDSNGNVVKEITYDSFGTILSDSNPNLSVNLGFAGGLYDQDTKLTRFGYRDYDAETGKWTAKDPIGFAGGDTNLYGYVLNDPVNFVDPLGLFDFSPMTGMPSWTDKPLFDALQTMVETEVGATATTAAVGGMCLVAPPLWGWTLMNPDAVSFAYTVGDMIYGGLSPEPPTTPTQAIGAGLNSLTDSLFGN